MIVYACSTNAGKLAEFALAAHECGLPELTVERLSGLEHIPQPDENGATFEENASIKALYYSRFTPELLFADDSGLEVKALAGGPGIHSARYSGPGGTDEANNALLLRNLQNEANRAARFVCVIALARAERILGTFRGSVEGQILAAPAGSAGFGYDPLFFYPPLERSFAELSPGEKLGVSHRGQALRQLLADLSRSTLGSPI